MKQDTANQRHNAENPVFCRAEIFAAGTAAERICADAEQRKANGSDHTGGDNRRNQLDPILGK